MTNHDEQLKAVARLVSGRPDWIDAPAVQAWHRSDGRTEHDGTPGKPRIWSPDHRTTERWSTPSLQNVHWSDLVDVVPLAAPAGSYTRTDEGAHIGPDGEVDWHGLYLSENRRAEKAERERDEARAELARNVSAVRQSFSAHTPREHLDAAWEAAYVPENGVIPAGAEYMAIEDDGTVVTGTSHSAFTSSNGIWSHRLLDPPTPKRPAGAEEWYEELGEMPAASDLSAEQRARLADALAERDHALGVRVTEDDAR